LPGAGDSAGPAFIGQRIAGVVSDGDDGEFDDEVGWTRVSSYKDWIEQVIKGKASLQRAAPAGPAKRAA